MMWLIGVILGVLCVACLSLLLRAIGFAVGFVFAVLSGVFKR